MGLFLGRGLWLAFDLGFFFSLWLFSFLFVFGIMIDEYPAVITGWANKMRQMNRILFSGSSDPC